MLEAVLKCILHNVNIPEQMLVSSVNDAVCLADWRSTSRHTDRIVEPLWNTPAVWIGFADQIDYNQCRTRLKVSFLFSLTVGEVVFWRLDLWPAAAGANHGLGVPWGRFSENVAIEMLFGINK